MSKRRVVVTGLGMVSPVGLDVASSWENILAGKSGIKPITHLDIEPFSVRFGGPIYGFDIEQYIPKKEARKMDKFIHYGIAAADQAIKDAGIAANEENAGRIGVVVGSGIGGITGIEQGYAAYLKGGPRKISPFFVPANIVNMVAGHISIINGFKGPNLSIVSACSTGAHCIADGMRMIQYGTSDVIVAGGAEMATSPTGLGGFAAAKELSNHNNEPEGESRPREKDREGF
ncbi:beta-ketoacyl synthase N-terminal-like domain-containing protein, partial [Thiolapillus sp.]